MSAFVWLDYPERERRKMLDVVEEACGHVQTDLQYRASAPGKEGARYLG